MWTEDHDVDDVWDSGEDALKGLSIWGLNESVRCGVRGVCEWSASELV